MTRSLRLAAAAVAVAAFLAPVAPAQASVHLSDIDPLAVGMAASTGSTPYAFSSYVAGKPVRWNPCAAIHWKFRTTALPSGVTARAALSVVSAAVTRVARATGTTWKYDGATTAVPTSRWLPTSSTSINPVLIGWTDGSHSDLLRGQPAAVLGVTRTAYFGTSVAGVTLAATKAAVIALDRTNRLALSGTAQSWKSVLLHELSHAMGMAHVGNSRQMMYPVLSRTLTDLQSGDLAGLAKLGRSAGCIDLGF